MDVVVRSADARYTRRMKSGLVNSLEGLVALLDVEVRCTAQQMFDLRLYLRIEDLSRQRSNQMCLRTSLRVLAGGTSVHKTRLSAACVSPMFHPWQQTFVMTAK